MRSPITWHDKDTEILQVLDEFLKKHVKLKKFSLGIVSLLDPTKVPTVGLSASNINILIGEVILQFLLLETKSAEDQRHHSLLAKKIDLLEQRFHGRRDAVLNTLILYLNNRDILRASTS